MRNQATDLMTPIGTMEAIEALMVADVDDASRRDQMLDYLADEIASPPSATDDIFRLIVSARGCHAISAHLHATGRPSDAGLYTALGQDILGKAASVLAEHVANDARLHMVTFQ